MWGAACEGETWLVDLKSGKGSVTKGGKGPADLTVSMSDDTFFQISQGKLNAQQVRMPLDSAASRMAAVLVHALCRVLISLPLLQLAGFHEGRHQDQG